MCLHPQEGSNYPNVQSFVLIGLDVGHPYLEEILCLPCVNSSLQLRFLSCLTFFPMDPEDPIYEESCILEG